MENSKTENSGLDLFEKKPPVKTNQQDKQLCLKFIDVLITKLSSDQNSEDTANIEFLRNSFADSEAEAKILEKALNYINLIKENLDSTAKIKEEHKELVSILQKKEQKEKNMADNLTQWEYTVAPTPDNEKKIDNLNKLGKEGWESTGILQSSGQSTQVLLKRPIRQQSQDYGY